MVELGFGLTRKGSGWRVKVPDGYIQGQVGEGYGGQDRDRIKSGRGSKERYLTSRVMARRDGSKMVETWWNRPRRVRRCMGISSRRRVRRERSGWLRRRARSRLQRAKLRLLTSQSRLLKVSLR